MEDGFQALLMTCRLVGIPETGAVMAVAVAVGIKQNPVNSRFFIANLFSVIGQLAGCNLV